MKKFLNKIAIFTLLAATLGLGGCAGDWADIVDSISLNRCLAPMNFEAKIQNGEYINFSWDATVGADKYELQVSTSESFDGTPFFGETIKADQNPFTVHAEADVTYYARIRAIDSAGKKNESKWTTLDGSVKTYAVKSSLNPYVSDRTDTSVTIAWTVDSEVTHVAYYMVGANDQPLVIAVPGDDIAAGHFTVTGLAPSTYYNISVNFKSANRGEVAVWTRPSTGGATVVTTAAALSQAITDGAAKILVKYSSDPYDLSAASIEIKSTLALFGEEAADGSKPKIIGEMHFADGFNGSFYAEGIDFDGNSYAKGFVIQGKNGGAGALTVTSCTFNNCILEGYSKGLFYEWGHAFTIGDLTWENCYIRDFAGNGGDCIDFRNASTKIGSVSIKNNTISEGFRTFLRIDANVTVTSIAVDNNTFNNVSNFDNTNNQGILGVKAATTAFTLKNNLFLNETAAQSKLVGPTALVPSTISGNYFYNCSSAAWWNDVCPQATGTAQGGTLSVDPCFNSLSGIFNLTNQNLLKNKIGASAWWISYVEPEVNLTITPLTGAKLWDFSLSKTFNGSISKSKAIDNLLFTVNGSTIGFTSGILGFSTAASLDSNNLPVDCAVSFKVSTPGSVYVIPVATVANNGKHVIVAVNGVVKGGAAPATAANTPVKILLADITGESTVSVYGSGAVGMSSLMWSLDTEPIANSLKAPSPVMETESLVEGTSQDVVVSWATVPNAASYSVSFSGKTVVVTDTSYTIPAQTVGFLSAGNYPVLVVANPSEEDIYYSASTAGKGVLTITKPAGNGGGSGVTVGNITELLSALGAGKSEIKLSAGTFDITTATDASISGGVLALTAPVTLTGEDGAIVKGGFSVGGALGGSVTFENIEFDGAGSGIAFTVLNATAESISVTDCYIHGYSKSVIYANNDDADVDLLLFDNDIIKNIGTGQGTFDIRKGTFKAISIRESTVADGGRDFIRLDASTTGKTTSSLSITNNTFSNISLGAANSVLYVRRDVATYAFSGNLVINEATANTILAKTGTKVPAASNNFFYNCSAETWWTGTIDQAAATANGGVVLTENPVRDSSAGDFTLVNSLAMSCKVGATRWNPAAYMPVSEVFSVKSSAELISALSAGKANISLAYKGSPYEIGTVTVVKNMHLTGEVSGGKYPTVKGAFNLSGDSGTVVFENLEFTGDKNDSGTTNALAVLLNVSGDLTANAVMVKNCNIKAYNKSVFYGNNDNTDVSALLLSGVKITDIGTGQGAIDIRKGTFRAIILENSTVAEGCRDFIRLDASTTGKTTGTVAIRNNTFCNVSAGASNSLLYVRRDVADYTLTANLFLNESTANTVFAKTGTKVPVMNKNYFYNCTAASWWTGTISESTATAGGGVLADSPVRSAANGDYTLTNYDLLTAGIGDPRWY